MTPNPKLFVLALATFVFAACGGQDSGFFASGSEDQADGDRGIGEMTADGADGGVEKERRGGALKRGPGPDTSTIWRRARAWRPCPRCAAVPPATTPGASQAGGTGGRHGASSGDLETRARGDAPERAHKNISKPSPVADG